MASIKKAGDLLSSLLNENFNPQTLKNARITAGLFTSWSDMTKDAGISAAGDHCRIRDLERGVLFIEADHPGWVQILQTKQDFLLKSFQKKFPQLHIQGISFCLSKTPVYRPPAGNETTAVAVNPVNGPPDEEKNEELHESIKKFKKIIQKRKNSGN